LRFEQVGGISIGRPARLGAAEQRPARLHGPHQMPGRVAGRARRSIDRLRPVAITQARVQKQNGRPGDRPGKRMQREKLFVQNAHRSCGSSASVGPVPEPPAPGVPATPEACRQPGRHPRGDGPCTRALLGDPSVLSGRACRRRHPIHSGQATPMTCTSSRLSCDSPIRPARARSHIP